MKAITNCGIKRVVYFDEYLRIVDGSDGSKKISEPEARDLAHKRGVVLEKYRDKNVIKDIVIKNIENIEETFKLPKLNEKSESKSKPNNLSRW